MSNTVKNIDKHIRERTREPRQIITGKTKSIQIPPKSQRSTSLPTGTIPVQGYYYTCRFFTYPRDAAQYSDNIAITENSLTYNHTDSGSAGDGVYNNGAWTDSNKTWTVDEWIGHYLKVGGYYWKILSNTADVLTVQVDANLAPDDSLEYSIVPFKPGQFIGSRLVPNTAIPEKRIVISNNTETVITVDMNIMEESVEVTTGDGSSPFNTFIASALANTSPDDYWNNYSVLFTSGDNNNVAKPISDFISTTGTFITDNFTNSVDIGDTFSIREDLLFAVGSTSFSVQNYRTPVDDDFTSAPGLGNVITKKVFSVDGEMNESLLPNYINAIYSIELHAKESGVIPMNIDCRDSIKIALTPADDSSETNIIHDSGYKPNEVTSVDLNFTGGVWYRLDIYFYAENGSNGLRLSTILSDIIDAWRYVTPPMPTNFGAAGGDKEVTLTWDQDPLFKTQIWVSDDDSDFSWLATVQEGEARYSHIGLDANATKYYKIRHQNDRGDLSDYTNSFEATTWEDAGSKYITVKSDYYPYIKEGDVVTIGVNFGSALEDTPTVELYDENGDTLEDATLDSQDGSDYQFTHTIPAGLNEGGTFYYKVQALALSGEIFDVESGVFIIDYTPPTINDSLIVIDSDGITTTLNEERVVRSSNFIITRSGALSDSLAGVWKYYAQPCLVCTTTSVGANFLIAESLKGWGVYSLSGYYLVDSQNNRYTISGFNTSTGQISLDGTPSAGVFYIMKYAQTSQASWPYPFNYNDNGVNSALLNANMPTNWLHNFNDPVVKYGFVITGSDKANNIETNLANFGVISVRYNTNANIPVKHQWMFWDGTQIVTPNENGWLNSTNLFLRLIVDADPDTIGSLFYSRFDGSDWEDWQEDITGQGKATHIYDINLTAYEGRRSVQFHITNSLGVPTTNIIVDFNYDKTKPTWTIVGGSATGGIERITLGWSNQPTDSGSGVSHVNIYRNTVNSFPSGDPIGRTQNVDQFGYNDANNVQTQTYYYWGKAVDFAGNIQTTPQAIGGSVESHLIGAADVDKKLGITSTDEEGGTAWQDRHGVPGIVEGIMIRTKTIASGSPSLNFIRHSEDGASWTDVSDPKIEDTGITISNYPIASNSTYVITISAMSFKKYWRVKFNNIVVAIDENGNVEAGSEIEDVHFTTFYAADLLVGNLLQLKNGLTVKAKGTGDAVFLMDQAGQLAKDQAGNILWDLNYINAYMQLGFLSGNYLKYENGILVTRGLHLTQGGEELANGYAYYTGLVYKRASTRPGTPAQGDGEYNFDTKFLTAPAGWYPYAVEGANTLYVTQATFKVLGGTGTDSDPTWGSVREFVKDGDDGEDGADGANGSDGERGSRHFSKAITGTSWDNDIAYDHVESQMGAGNVVKFDTVMLYNNSAGWAETRYYVSGAEASSVWTQIIAYFDGSILVQNTVAADKLDVNQLSAIVADLGTVTAGVVKSSDNKVILDLNNKYLKIEHSSSSIYTRMESSKMYRTYDNGTHKHDISPVLIYNLPSSYSGGTWLDLYQSGVIDVFGLGSWQNYRKLRLVSLIEYKNVSGDQDEYHTMEGTILRRSSYKAQLWIPTSTFQWLGDRTRYAAFVMADLW